MALTKMIYQHSNYDSVQFGRLDSKIQNWVWRQGWKQLNDIQQKAIDSILDESADVIISAPTASGKTEAAFLPIISLVHQNLADTLKVLYISPLKALINDQYDRIKLLTDRLDIEITKWHGDVSQSIKKRFWSKPSTILMITPESVESLLINKSEYLNRLFCDLDFIIIDELHSFIATERGIQLLSLMNRIERIKGSIIRRIGLSATLGDFNVACNYLRFSNPGSVKVLQSDNLHHTFKLQIKGYTNSKYISKGVVNNEPSTNKIIDNLYKTLRGTNNLLFANSRKNTESYSLLLKTKCENELVPNEFFPHYSNLSKEVREDLEDRLKNGSVPTTAVCTSTLELGIDIGKVKSIAQVGHPPSVSSFRQRLGRSGRRGEPSIARIYITENEISTDSSVQDLIRAELVQTIAIVELLFEKWYEPADSNNLNLSTLIHQILAIICQYGGAKAKSLYNILVDQGPFNVTPEIFVNLLKTMGNQSLIIQDTSGLLLLGKRGEAITNHFSFYAVFQTPEEFTLENEGNILGTLPIVFPVTIGQLLIFNAQKWRVTEVDPKRKRIFLIRSVTGIPPKFYGDVALINDEIRKRMREVYLDNTLPIYLDGSATELLKEARYYFQKLNLNKFNILKESTDTILVFWMGDKTINTISLILVYQGLNISREGFTLRVVKATPEKVYSSIQNFLQNDLVDEYMLSSMVPTKASEKYDEFLDDELLNMEYSSKFIDLNSARKALKEFITKNKLNNEIKN